MLTLKQAKQMGNCQASEAVAVVVHHPGGKVETAYWSLTAEQVMVENPGHYVAAIIMGGDEEGPVRQLKLLRPADMLLVGKAYRLVSFEEVLRDFGSKKRVKRLRVEKKRTRRDRGGGEERGGDGGRADSSPVSEVQGVGSSVNGMQRMVLRMGNWRPSLQRIEEIGSFKFRNCAV